MAGNSRASATIPEPPALDQEGTDNAFRDLTGELEVTAPDQPVRVTIDVTACLDGDANCIKVQAEGSTFTGFDLDLNMSKKLVRELGAANEFVHAHTQLQGNRTVFENTDN